MFDFVKTFIGGVVEIHPDVYRDDRGYFIEGFRWETFADNLKSNVAADVRQINMSYSNKNVLRGLHYQDGPKSQSKIVHVLKGSVIDVVVDIRPSSPTFKKSIKYKLDAKNHLMLHIPIGCAHGFLSLEDETIFMYFCCNEYDRFHDRGIRYNDPDLGIDWSCRGPVLSEKDLNLPFLKDIELCGG